MDNLTTADREFLIKMLRREIRNRAPSDVAEEPYRREYKQFKARTLGIIDKLT